MTELRWGILGSGKICSDFANALRALGYPITAVAASTAERAAAFAKSFGVPTSYGSYEELVLTQSPPLPNHFVCQKLAIFMLTRAIYADVITQ